MHAPLRILLNDKIGICLALYACLPNACNDSEFKYTHKISTIFKLLRLLATYGALEVRRLSGLLASTLTRPVGPVHCFFNHNVLQCYPPLPYPPPHSPFNYPHYFHGNGISQGGSSCPASAKVSWSPALTCPLSSLPCSNFLVHSELHL